MIIKIEFEVAEKDLEGIYTWHEAMKAGWYWSSTEEDSDYAWLQFFDDGAQSWYYKDNNGRVRLVRDV